MTKNDLMAAIAVAMLIAGAVSLFRWASHAGEARLNFHGHFKPKQHYFFEKCCKCGKRLKHYHWFWGKGDKMGCDVDYHGNTEWYCEECDNKIHKNTIHYDPNIYGG